MPAGGSGHSVAHGADTGCNAGCDFGIRIIDTAQVDVRHRLGDQRRIDDQMLVGKGGPGQFGRQVRTQGSYQPGQGDGVLRIATSGARSWQVLIVLYVISAILAGVAGFLYSGASNTASVTLADSAVLPPWRRP